MARCLDITRLVSRLGRGVATGIDRVELAYLEHFVADAVPCFLFLRTWAGYVLVGPDQAAAVAAKLRGQIAWGRSDLLGLLRRRAHPLKRRAEADIRRTAIARCRRGRLAAMLARFAPEGCAYFNVGHSNLNKECLADWAGVGSVNVLIHDTIPLDFPQYQRGGTVARFEDRLHATLNNASRIICISKETGKSVTKWADQWGISRPLTTIAPIGVTLPGIDETSLPGTLRSLKQPYFVTLGTIEPRKNHGFLLDLWLELMRTLPAAELPRLVIVGARGWQNAKVFDRLDGSPMMGRQVLEVNDLPDAALGALLKRSAGLLFPTLAEGFGLPPIESAALGVPVICNDLPVLRENLAEFPIYAPVSDMYLWKQSILQLAGENTGQTGDAQTVGTFKPPTWAGHFNIVLNLA